MANFLGSTVRITLDTGHVQGTLSKIDASQGSLVLEHALSEQGILSPYLVINRDVVRDLQLISVGSHTPSVPSTAAASSAAQKSVAFADPAILSVRSV